MTLLVRDGDGFGLDISMELTRIFSEQKVATPATMLLTVAVADEEQGLFRSTTNSVAQFLFNASADFQAAFTNGIVGAILGDDGASERPQ